MFLFLFFRRQRLIEINEILSSNKKSIYILDQRVEERQIKMTRKK
jgi:hypothetical protein